MAKLTIRIHNLQTDEIIDREMTAAELAIYNADEKADQLEKIQIEAKKAQRQAIADRLNLTADELQVLLG